MDGDQDGAHPGSSSQPLTAPIESADIAHSENITDCQHSITKRDFADRMNRTDRWIIRLTGVIAFSGVVSAVIFGWQLRVMQGQLDEMKQSFASDRAYVLNGGFSGVGDREIIAGDVVTITFENFGKTPAEIRTVGTSCKFSPNLPPTVSTDHSEIPPGYILESGHSIPRITVPIEVSAKEIVEAKASSGHVFCEAATGYNDVRGVRHETIFTFVYDFGHRSWILYNDEKWNHHT